MKVILLPALRDNYIFILINLKNNNAMVVDPSLAKPVIDYATNHKLNIKYILNTHHHYDHVGGNNEIKNYFDCKVIASEYDKDRIPGVDILVKDGDYRNFEEFKYEVMYVPGHTLGHVAYFFPEEKKLFCGDTLFSIGCGRLFEGTAEQMHRSLEKIKALPIDTQIYCAHEYTENNANFAITIDPENKDLIDYIKQIRVLRKQKLATIPSSLDIELKINPFLRSNSMQISKSMHMEHNTNIEVFTKIRELKDNF